MIKVLMCGPLALSGGVSNHTKNLTKCLSKLGVKIIFFNLSGKDTKSLEASPFRKIYQRTVGLTFEAIKRRKECDIIHIQASGGIFSFMSTITGALVSKICNKKLIVTFHYRPSQRFVKKYKRLFAFVLRNSKAFIVVSKKQKSIIEETFPNLSNKIFVISNGFDSNYFRVIKKENCRKNLNLPKDKKTLLSVGNLLEVKGYKYLIEAVNEIVKYRKEILVIIVGFGHLKKKMEQQIKNLSLERHVHLVGAKPHDEIPIWINACDVFVLPSLAESFGIVQIEAMACGKPVVATYNGGSEEIITSEDYGFLVEPANPKVLAEKILIALDKKWDHERILRYAERFRWENIAKEIIEIYKGVGKCKSQ
jgi:glycosyltransferase involved in cell wall biosynthesis